MRRNQWSGEESKCDFIFNSFTEIKFTNHTVHPFKVCNSVVFSITTELCKHRNNHSFCAPAYFSLRHTAGVQQVPVDSSELGSCSIFVLHDFQGFFQPPKPWIPVFNFLPAVSLCSVLPPLSIHGQRSGRHLVYRHLRLLEYLWCWELHVFLTKCTTAKRFSEATFPEGASWILTRFFVLIWS